MPNRNELEESQSAYQQARNNTIHILRGIFTKENALTIALGADRAYNAASGAVGLFMQYAPPYIQDAKTCEEAIKQLNDPTWLATFVATIIEDDGNYTWTMTFLSCTLGFTLYFSADQISKLVRNGRPLFEEKTKDFLNRLTDSGIFALSISVLINFLPWHKGLRYAAQPFAALPFVREIFQHYHPNYPEVPTLHNLNAVISGVPYQPPYHEPPDYRTPEPFSNLALTAAGIELISQWIALASSFTSLAGFWVDYYRDAYSDQNYPHFNDIANMIAVGTLPLSMLGMLYPSLYRFNNAAACFAATAFYMTDLPLSWIACFLYPGSETVPPSQEMVNAIKIVTALGIFGAVGHTLALHWPHHTPQPQAQNEFPNVVEEVSEEEYQSKESNSDDIIEMETNGADFVSLDEGDSSSLLFNPGSSRISADTVFSSTNSSLSLHSMFSNFKRVVCQSLCGESNSNNNQTRQTYGIQ
jgi:hypothetical protein